MESLDMILGPIMVIVADLIVFVLIGRLGKRTSGTGVKYRPFSGGEESIPQRGLYQSNLFVFAVLFLVAEAFTLMLAGSFAASSSYYPLLFLAGGGGSIILAIWWYVVVGGGEI